MKSTFLLLTLILTTAATGFAQDSGLTREQVQSIQKLINAFKTKNKAAIAGLVHYPLRREYPLKDVKNKNELLRRFDDIFDPGFLEKVGRSKTTSWTQVGWRGIMFNDGGIWTDDDGKIMTLNYQSPQEKQLLVMATQADKDQLPKSLQDFQKPVYLILTKNYKIRIDEKSDGVYRYAAWKIKNQQAEPDIIIENGVWEFRGSGGNHTITFKNEGYTYIVSINIIGAADTPDATLEIVKQDKTILTANGKINRN